MNLVLGEIVSAEEAKAALSALPEGIQTALAGEPLHPDVVLDACDALSNRLNEREHLPLLMDMGLHVDKARRELAQAKRMLSREYLERRLAAEFGGDYLKRKTVNPLDAKQSVTQWWAPLGVLMHIAAGNAQGLPVFSVIEGLLTGNVNILKLPGEEDGLSIVFLWELIAVEPALAEFVYAFDFPSQDIQSMQQMAKVADGIVVWGGDAAVSAVRRMAAPDTKLIEWGTS